jgi:hypothetical protein
MYKIGLKLNKSLGNKEKAEEKKKKSTAKGSLTTVLSPFLNSSEIPLRTPK